MKTLIAFLVSVLANGLFRFQYSDMLVNCMPQQIPSSRIRSGISEGNQSPVSSLAHSCMSQGAICGGPGSEGSAMACFAYPKEQFKDKPHFVAATFFVAEIQSAKTEEVCLKGSPNWFVISSKAEKSTINHVTFKTFEIGDNGQVVVNPDLRIELFTMESAMSWVSKLSFHVQSMIWELSRISPRRTGPKWRAA